MERAPSLSLLHLDAVPNVLVLQLDERSPQLHPLPKVLHDLLAYLLGGAA